MFGLNPGNCLSALGSVGTGATMKRLMATHRWVTINFLTHTGGGGPYGALSTSFGRLQTEHPQTGHAPDLSIMDKRI